MPSPIPFLTIALAMLAAPAAAQQRPQDFTLPEPSPGASPRPQGPVDDSGVVPVGPRVIPTSPPASQTPASPAPTPIPALTPAPTPAPALARPGDVAAPKRASRPMADHASPPPSAPANQPAPPESTKAGVAQGPSQAAPTPATDPVTALSGGAWPWVIAALLGTILLSGGWIWQRRRARSAPPPRIEPPLRREAAEGAPCSANKARVELTLEIESAARSVMQVTVQYRLSVVNRSPMALRDLAVAADLVSASRTTNDAGQLTDATTALPPAGTIAGIGPHQRASMAGTLQLPVSAIEVMRQGQHPIFVPLVRLRLEAAGIDPQPRTFALGIGSELNGERLRPLPLSGPPGGLHGVRARSVGPVT